jgi:predicted RNase H-like HicB family nuclease
LKGILGAGGILRHEETAKTVNVKIVVHDVPPEEGGGYWAEVPALPGCRTQGDSWEELMANIREVVEGWLLIDVEPIDVGPGDQVLEIAV